MKSDTQIGRISPEFRDMRVEDRFRRWRYRDNLMPIRILGVIWILAAIPFLSAVYLRLGDGIEFQIISSARWVSIMFGAVLLYATWKKWSYRTLDWMVLVAVITICAQLVLLTFIAGSKIKLLEVQYLIGLVIIYVFIPNRFILNALPSIFLSGFFLIWVLLSEKYITSERIGLIGWLVAINFLGAFTAQRLERLKRREFLSLVFERDINAELLAAKQSADLASRTKSEFLANMSHELRTPLNAIIGFSDMMLMGYLGPLGDHRYKEYVEDIKNSGTHLLELINEILDLSKIEAGKRELVETRFQATQLINECLRLVEPRASESKVSLVNDTDFGLPDLWADRIAIKQVLLNLIANAIKFNKAGGDVTVTGFADATDGICIQVCDTGIGIEERNLEKVMTPFHQVEGNTARIYEGSGLGLAIAKTITELHGGTLTLESVLGVGTKVSIRLPAERILETGSAVPNDEPVQETDTLPQPASTIE